VWNDELAMASPPSGAGHGWRIRPGQPADVPILRAMLYEAAYWQPARPRPPIEAALTEPHLARYVDGWGRPGDRAVIAETEGGRPIGAAWYRLFSAAEPGYGFIDAATPELSLAVAADWRGQGVGTALLTALLTATRAAGIVALSLSVEVANPAVHLYQRHGFVQVSEAAGAWTMRADLAAPGGPSQG
jgi:ribosomal protein S18 acetylase RimI-like enzyme